MVFHILPTEIASESPAKLIDETLKTLETYESKFIKNF